MAEDFKTKLEEQWQNVAGSKMPARLENDPAFQLRKAARFEKVVQRWLGDANVREARSEAERLEAIRKVSARDLEKLRTMSDRIRALELASIPRARIKDILGISYQHVRNVLEQDRAQEEKAARSTTDVLDGGLRSTKVRIGPEGRVVIPASYRETLGLKEGDVLFARLEEGEIKLLTPKAAMERAQAMVREFVPEGVSLVDELIEDRRREVARETERG